MAPAVVLVRLQLAVLFGAVPAVSVTGPQLALPSLMVTVPVGEVLTAATLTLTVYGWPTTEGSGRSEVIVVVVGCWSSSTRVPVPVNVPGVALVMPLRLTLKVSLPSKVVSPLIVTGIVTLVWPAGIVNGVDVSAT